MKIILDTGSVLVNLALVELFSLSGHRALPAADVRPGFSPDIILVGNNFDTAVTISIFPGGKTIVLDIDLSADRFEQALHSHRVHGILPRSVDLKGFDEATRRIISRGQIARSAPGNGVKASLGPAFN